MGTVETLLLKLALLFSNSEFNTESANGCDCDSFQSIKESINIRVLTLT